MFGRKPKAGEEQEKLGFFGRLRARLNRGDSFLTRDLGELFRGRQIDAAALEELETRLLTADAGVEATEHILEGLKKRVDRKELADVRSPCPTFCSVRSASISLSFRSAAFGVSAVAWTRRSWPS